MKQRGAALPTILALITVILVAGLAMGSLSSLSLQFNQKQMDRTRAELAARSGLAVFLSKTTEHDAKNSESEQLNPLKPSPFDVTELLENGLEHEENGYKVSLHFKASQEGRSTDNSTGEVAVQGWSDAESDGVPRVPPFALDLVFKVEHGSDEQYFRATLKRVWPFAVYTAVGPILLMGNIQDGSPAGTQPSFVDGAIYTQWRSQEAGGGAVLAGYGYGELDEPSKLLANLEARQGYHPAAALNQQPCYVGTPLAQNPRRIPDVNEPESDDTTMFYKYDNLPANYNLSKNEQSFNFEAVGASAVDGGNSLVGKYVVDYDANERISPVLAPATPENRFDGDVSVRRGLALDPLFYYRADKLAEQSSFDSGGYSEITIPPPDNDLEDAFTPVNPIADSVEPGLLEETLKLSPDEAPPGVSKSPHYVIDGSVSNRQVLFSDDDKTLYVRENHAGLELQDVVLHVKGDLDLGANQFDEAIKIFGSGATLIVDGKLILGNAQFDAVDQGFVIFAEDIVLTGSGEFRGLMIASNSISILSRKEDEPLVIAGGVMCGGYGGVTLRGTKVIHEPRYLKSINGGGDFFLHSWEKLK